MFIFFLKEGYYERKNSGEFARHAGYVFSDT